MIIIENGVTRETTAEEERDIIQQQLPDSSAQFVVPSTLNKASPMERLLQFLTDNPAVVESILEQAAASTLPVQET